jgi:hypothetical protein
MAKKAITASHNLKVNAPTTKAGVGCLLLFALPFAAVGVVMLAMCVAELWTWQAARRWIETPATLLAAELETHNGDDGVTYEATARYTYEFRGKPYTSEQVGLHSGSDNIGHYHEDRAAELEKIEQAGGRLPCFVNPGDPTQALLYRDLRPGMVVFKLVFAVTFGGVGFGLLIGSVIGYRSEQRKEVAKKAAPDQPWTWRDDWAAGRIRSSEGGLLLVATLFAVIWNGVTWPAGFAVLDDVRRGAGPPSWLVAAFPLVGVLIAAWATYLWMQRLRWGRSEFEMAAVPGVLGGPLAGVIHAPRGLAPLEGFTLRLACTRTITEESGGDSTTRSDVEWERETTILRDFANDEDGRTLVPVKFIVPYGLPPSADDVTWTLEAKAEVFGIDYAARFEVPVFRTSASSKQIDEQATSAALGEESAPPTIAATVARFGGVLEEELPDNRQILFPAARNRGLAAFAGMFAVALATVCYLLFTLEAPQWIAWLVTAFGALPLYLAVANCFGSTRLEYGGRGASYVHRKFGIGRPHELPVSRIASVDVDKSGTALAGRAYRKVFLTTTEGERTTLVHEVGSVQDAEGLAEDMRQLLGLTESRTADGPSRMKLEAELPGDFRGE